MTTTTEIRTITLDLTALAAEFRESYDMQAANAAYRDEVAALARQIVPSVTLVGAGDSVQVIADWDDRERARARDIDWDALADQVDGYAILAGAELHVVTTILVPGAEQVVDRESVTRAGWDAIAGATLSVGDTGGEPGQAYRVELVRGSGVDEVVVDAFETTAQ